MPRKCIDLKIWAAPVAATFAAPLEQQPLQHGLQGGAQEAEAGEGCGLAAERGGSGCAAAACEEAPARAEHSGRCVAWVKACRGLPRSTQACALHGRRLRPCLTQLRARACRARPRPALHCITEACAGGRPLQRRRRSWASVPSLFSLRGALQKQGQFSAATAQRPSVAAW